MFCHYKLIKVAKQGLGARWGRNCLQVLYNYQTCHPELPQAMSDTAESVHSRGDTARSCMPESHQGLYQNECFLLNVLYNIQ